MNNPLGVSPRKGNRKPHEAKKKSFDLGGNRTHDLRIRSCGTTFICVKQRFVVEVAVMFSKTFEGTSHVASER